MKKSLLAGALMLSSALWSAELGLKLGGASIKQKDIRDPINLSTYAALYIDLDTPLSPLISAGPSFEIASGSVKVGDAYCSGWGSCRIDFTYTTLEANGKIKVKLTMIQLFGGAGVSLNRFGLDAYDSSGTKIGTLGDINATGLQVFGGAMLTFGVFGVGAEYKVKSINLPDVEYVSHYTVNLALVF
jgi:hypothetical protein